jgi:hypothetical protein
VALSTFGSCRRENQQRLAFPHATHLASVRPELLNRLAIPIVSIGHNFSSFACRSPRQGTYLWYVWCYRFMLPLLFDNVNVDVPNQTSEREKGSPANAKSSDTFPQHK